MVEIVYNVRMVQDEGQNTESIRAQGMLIGWACNNDGLQHTEIE